MEYVVSNKLCMVAIKKKSINIMSHLTTMSGQHSYTCTIGWVLNALFNDCVLGKSGQIANPMIAKVDPIPYYEIHAHLCL